MVTTGLQVFAFILAFTAWALMVATCVSPHWRENSVPGTVTEQHQRFDGLWIQCEKFPNGNTNCARYKSFFTDLPDILVACRLLMVAAIGIGFVGMILSVFGMKCTSIAAANQKAKASMALIGGIFTGIAAGCVGTSVSYYAHQVVEEYVNQVLPYNQPRYLRFEYGPALFLGWSSLVVGLIASFFSCMAAIIICTQIAKGKNQKPSYIGYKQLEGLRNQNPLTHAVQEYV